MGVANRRWSVWTVSFAAWTVGGIFQTGTVVIEVLNGLREGVAIWETAVWEMSSAYSFALLTPGVVWFALRVRLVGPALALRWGAHALATVGFSLLHVGGMVAMRKAAYVAMGSSYRFGNLRLEIPYEFFKDVLTYWVLVGLIYGFDYYRRYRRRELEAAQLATQLAQARLQNLKHQMQPHFLFNTLNTISAIMREDVDAADRMIAGLSDLLRAAMETGDRHEVPLHEETAILEAYLDIVRTRFQDRLRVDVDIPPRIRDAMVPAFVLQPLVENAIKHGVGDRIEGGAISVNATVVGSTLILTVRDDGPGSPFAPATVVGRGIGLSATRERLAQLYGKAGRLALRNDDDGGFVASVSLPFHTEPSVTPPAVPVPA